MSEINKHAKERLMSAAGGEMMLEVFEAMAAQMELMSSSGQFTQFQFADATELSEGDLIPEVHLSLRRFEGHEMPQELIDRIEGNNTGE